MPRVPRVLLLEEGEKLLLGIGLRHDPVLDVRPVEARDEVLRVRHTEPAGDLLVRGVRRGRRQRDARHVRPALAEHGQRQIVGAEVVAPLGDAVRLVDREDGDLAPGQQGERGVQPQPLGRQVEDVELAREELRLHRAALVEVLRGVHEAGPDAEGPQGVDLVLHEGDQGGDDDAGAPPDQGRDLVAEGLSAAGRHEHDRVAARHHMLDDRALLAAERLVPEDAVQCPARLALAARVGAGAGHRPGGLVHAHAQCSVPRGSAEGPLARPCPVLLSSPSTIGGANDNAGRSVDNRPSGAAVAHTAGPPARAAATARRPPPGSPDPGSTAGPGPAPG
ncbi:hypothetical protein GA0115255_106882 [Streptomyces sp. Ncost-T6T-2b]|nr:hypothetical protein GA0115255_106882 [Streptomyces sp. Ncost-T6T-2b]